MSHDHEHDHDAYLDEQAEAEYLRCSEIEWAHDGTPEDDTEEDET